MGKSALDTLIRDEIKREDRDWHARLPFLRHRDAIGAVLLVAIVVSIFAVLSLHYLEQISTVTCMLSMTFVLSTLHEIEHDLFHALYFGRPGNWKHETAMWPLQVPRGKPPWPHASRIVPLRVGPTGP